MKIDVERYLRDSSLYIILVSSYRNGDITEQDVIEAKGYVKYQLKALDVMYNYYNEQDPSEYNQLAIKKLFKEEDLYREALDSLNEFLDQFIYKKSENIV